MHCQKYFFLLKSHWVIKLIILSLNNICLSFGTIKILEDICLKVEDADKIGVVGVNGAGKSTLFKIMAGIYTPDSGEIHTVKNIKSGYLSQDSGLNSDKSIMDEMLGAFSHLIHMEHSLKTLEAEISIENGEDILSSYLREYSGLSDRFSLQGGYEFRSRAKGILKGLGFNENDFDKQVGILSGGQKTRLALAKLLVEEPDILLLDEPTNHLDISAIEWLEDFIRNYKKCMLVISHDRYFLDVTTNKTFEIENNRSKLYDGSYSAYAKQKETDRSINLKHYQMQQKEIARMEAFIEQQRQWNREKNIIAAESRQKAIDRMEKIDKPSELPSKIKIKFKTGIISGNDVLFAEKLAMEYPGKPLFNDVSFVLKKGEKAFLLGPNGCGKSTLFKIFYGSIEASSGSCAYGHNVNMGYYDQEQEDLDEGLIILEEVWNANPRLTQTQLRNMLASFLFTGEEVFKPINVLSGGEKSRVALAKLLISGSNLLLLDEPTNHLDINSREVLEDALLNYEGTILAISHDRYFVKKLADRILELQNAKIIDIKGDYTWYLEKRKALLQAGSTVSGAGSEEMSQAKLERIMSKEEKARQRKHEKDLAATEKAITNAEKRIEEINREMNLEDVLSDHVKLSMLFEELENTRKLLDHLYEKWGCLQEEM